MYSNACFEHVTERHKKLVCLGVTNEVVNVLANLNMLKKLRTIHVEDEIVRMYAATRHSSYYAAKPATYQLFTKSKPITSNNLGWQGGVKYFHYVSMHMYLIMNINTHFQHYSILNFEFLQTLACATKEMFPGYEILKRGTFFSWTTCRIGYLFIPKSQMVYWTNGILLSIRLRHVHKRNKLNQTNQNNQFFLYPESFV